MTTKKVNSSSGSLVSGIVRVRLSRLLIDLANLMVGPIHFPRREDYKSNSESSNFQRILDPSKVVDLQSLVADMDLHLLLHSQVLEKLLLPFERWGIDFYGPMAETKSGNKYLITCIDYATRWVLAKPVKDMTESAVAAFLTSLMMTYGAPFEIISDRGKSSWLKESTCLSAKTRSTLSNDSLPSSD
ncbi:hypothetical protein BASA84_001749 [Batrachochytrium salamandrivorans]|nr:hypothetical protein BASA84_001749 [Batrachochytrium salamandrivorans]